MLFPWQAHLSFILLGFVLLGSLRGTRRWRPWLLPLLALVSFIPVNHLPLAAYVRSFTDDLAISTLVLLGWASLLRLGVVQPVHRPADAGVGMAAQWLGGVDARAWHAGLCAEAQGFGKLLGLPDRSAAGWLLPGGRRDALHQIDLAAFTPDVGCRGIFYLNE